MSGKSRRDSTAPRRTSAAPNTGRGATRRPATTTKKVTNSHAAARFKKTMKPRMTQEADETMRAKTARRLSASTTKKSVTFTLDATFRRSVSIGGTFSNWEPQAITKGSDGLCRITLPLAPGTYEYKFLVDAEWVEDPSNPRKRANEHGGYNSVCDVM